MGYQIKFNNQTYKLGYTNQKYTIVNNGGSYIVAPTIDLTSYLKIQNVVAGSGINVLSSLTGVTISSTSTGGGTITGATNGLQLYGKNIGLITGMYWNSVANTLGIGTTPSAKLHVQGNGLSTDNAFRIDNSSSVQVLGIQDNGVINVGSLGNTGTINLKRSSDGGVIGTIAGNSNYLALTAGQGITIAGSQINFSANPNVGMRYVANSGLYVCRVTENSQTPASRLVVIGNTAIGANSAAPANGLLVAGDTVLGTTATIGSTTNFSNATLHLNGSGSVPTLLTVGAGTTTNYSIRSFQSDSVTQIFSVQDNGNISGKGGTTSMTDGFFYIPSASGAPSGTPTSVSGSVPMYYDSANNNFYVYNGAWKKVTLT